MAKITAPFTDEQVDALHEWQAGMVKFDLPDGGMIIQPTHPFTCCSHDGCNRLEQPNQGALIPTNDGWVCPCGKYKQDWCHDFMIKPVLVLAEPPGKSLTKYVIDLLKLASEKGFTRYNDFMDLIWQHGWQKDEKTFCVVACAGIQSWLREKYKLEAWVEPVTPGRYKGFVQYFGLRNKTDSYDSAISNNYEMHLIGAIDFALNALPPAAQE